MADFAETFFLVVDAVFATISAVTCIIFFIKHKHPIRWLFLFLAPWLIVISVLFCLRAFGVYEIDEVSGVLRPLFFIVFFTPALFYFALKDTMK